MLWENLTSEEFIDALKVTKGVAIIPIGCLEKHGYHMPLGTDMFIAKELAEKAGVSRATICGLESGSISVTTTETLMKIASALGKKVSDIFLD